MRFARIEDDDATFQTQASGLVTPASTLPSGIPQRPRLCILGSTKIGLTHGACSAELGYDVLCFDADVKLIDKLGMAEIKTREPGLEEMVRRNLSAGRLRFTSDRSEAAAFGDVYFIFVPTPQRADGMGADLSQVEDVITSLAAELSRKVLLVGRVSAPVGTAAWIETLVAKHSPPAGEVEVAWSPEFIQDGSAVEDALRPSRLVLGVGTAWAQAMLLAANKGIFDLAHTEDREVPVIATDLATAELVKPAANAFLATKISFINAMAEICEATGADVNQLARALGYDDRIGKKYLRAGVGFGGPGLARDIRAFQARAQELGVGEALRFLHEVDLINQRRRNFVVQLAAELLDRPYGPAGPDLTGFRIAVLGATYKPGTDDIQDSPGLAIARKLARSGSEVRVYDPQGTESAERDLPDVSYAKSLPEAIQGADLVCVLTEWDEFRHADPRALAQWVHGKRIIDGRNCLDPIAWASAGWAYRSIGRPVPHELAQDDGATSGAQEEVGQPAEPRTDANNSGDANSSAATSLLRALMLSRSIESRNLASPISQLISQAEIALTAAERVWRGDVALVWFASPNGFLDGIKPIDALLAGKGPMVLAALEAESAGAYV